MTSKFDRIISEEMDDTGTDYVGMITRILKTGNVPFLEGPPGQGKTDLVHQIAKSLGYTMEEIQVPGQDEAALGSLPRVIQLPDGSWSYEILVPPWARKLTDNPKTILFFDEINRVPEDIVNKILTVILNKRIGNFKFPSETLIVAAGNRLMDSSSVRDLGDAFAQRVGAVKFNMPYSTWKKNFANKVEEYPEKGIKTSSIMSFLDVYHPKFFNYTEGSEGEDVTSKNKASPRSWSQLDRFLVKDGAETVPDIIEREEYVRSFLGPGATNAYITFLKHMLKLNYDKIINSKNISDLKNDIEALGAAFHNHILSGFVDRASVDFVNSMKPSQVNNLLKYIEFVADKKDSRTELLEGFWAKVRNKIADEVHDLINSDDEDKKAKLAKFKEVFNGIGKRLNASSKEIEQLLKGEK